MTIREMCESIGIDEEPLQCAFTIAAVLRTTSQGEPSTFEGDCRALVNLCKHYDAKVDDPNIIRKILDDLGPAVEIDIPDSVWMAIAEAD